MENDDKKTIHLKLINNEKGKIVREKEIRKEEQDVRYKLDRTLSLDNLPFKNRQSPLREKDTDKSPSNVLSNSTSPPNIPKIRMRLNTEPELKLVNAPSTPHIVSRPSSRSLSKWLSTPRKTSTRNLTDFSGGLARPQEDMTISYPYKVQHQVHVDYHWERGYTGLPKNWETNLKNSGYNHVRASEVSDSVVLEILNKNQSNSEDKSISKMEIDLKLEDFLTKDLKIEETYEIGDQFAEGTGTVLFLANHKKKKSKSCSQKNKNQQTKHTPSAHYPAPIYVHVHPSKYSSVF